MQFSVFNVSNMFFFVAAVAVLRRPYKGHCSQREREREGDIGSISLHNIESSPKGPTIDENDQV